MHPIDIENCLDTLTVLIDTREQPTRRAQKRYDSFGIEYRRQKLEYGDYTFNFTLNGKEFYSQDEKIKPLVMIERKMNLEELSNCLCQDRKRFKAEFERAKEHEAAIYLLVENGNWEMLMNGRYKTKFNQKAFFSSLVSWIARYRINIIFCKEELSGKIIKEILYRELKNRLERGDFG